MSSIKEKTYNRGGIQYRLAKPEDDPHLRHLLRSNAMDSWVKLAMEREPDYFAGCDLMGANDTVLGFTKEQVPVGMYSASVLPVFFNGKSTSMLYLGGLRVNPAYRHRIRILRDGFDSIPSLLGQKAALPCFTSIASDNLKARRVLEKGLRGLPQYHPVGELYSLVFSTRKAQGNGMLRCMTVDDVDRVVEFFNHHSRDFQFSTQLSASWLSCLDGSKGLELKDFFLYEKEGRVKACMAIWDQTAFKQIRVKSYGFPLSHSRGLYNLFASLTGRIELPPSGGLFKQAYLSFFALSDDEELSFLIKDILAKTGARGVDSLVLGLSAVHPYMDKIKPYSCHVYKTTVQTVSWGQEQESLLSQAVQPEIALL